MSTYLKLVEEEGIEVQKGHLGRRVGYFSSEIGPLNEIVHIRAYCQSLPISRDGALSSIVAAFNPTERRNAFMGIVSRSFVCLVEILHRFARVAHGRTRMIVFPLIRSVGLKAATASSRLETMPMLVRSRPSRTRWTISPS